MAKKLSEKYLQRKILAKWHILQKTENLKYLNRKISKAYFAEN